MSLTIYPRTIPPNPKAIQTTCYFSDNGASLNGCSMKLIKEY